jgi:hypothetical protein
MLVWLEMEDTAGRGEWVRSTTENVNIANIVMAPERDIEVKVNEREEFREEKWMVRVTDKKASFGVTFKDMEEKGTD